MPDLIDARNVSYTYPDGSPALSGVTFSVAPGEHLALLGPNGAGKSTLLLVLAGLLRPEGALHIDGEPLSRRDGLGTHGRVGLLFEDPDDQLFMPTVLDDVLFGPRNQGLPIDEARARALAALEAVGAADLADRSPHRLSLGQKRRVAIAGALAMRPQVLLLDEPLNGLDPRGRGMFLRLLGGLDQTLVIATHDLETARRLCTTALILNGGHLVAHGPAETLLSDDALLRHNDLLDS
jgi:cobalt/nickel transport system ATP-binding protein